MTDERLGEIDQLVKSGHWLVSPGDTIRYAGMMFDLVAEVRRLRATLARWQSADDTAIARAEARGAESMRERCPGATEGA